MNYKDKQQVGLGPTEAVDSACPDSDWPDGIGMIYLAMSPWDGMWKNRHQLMTRFARQMPVLYVESPIRLRQLRRDARLRARVWTDHKRPFCNHIVDGLHVFEQSANLPVSPSRFLRGVTRRRWLRQVRRAAHSIGIELPILWLSQPSQLFALTSMNEGLSIYHVVDEYSGYTGMAEDLTSRQNRDEQELLDSAGMTIVVSPELLAAKSGNGRDIQLVENAVDFERYRAAARSAQKTTGSDAMESPVLCYSGLIGKRLDFQLIRHVALNRPEYSIVLLGDVDERECESELQALVALPNVMLPGRRPPDDVPAFLSKATVGMLPYSLNLETMHISPLKMYEYMAAGLPVVSTAIPAALRHHDIVSVSDTADEFLESCDRAVRQELTKQVERGIEFASNNTWDNRVGDIARLIRKKLSGGRAVEESSAALDDSTVIV